MLDGFLALPLPLIVLISVGIPVMVVIPIVRLVRNSHVTTEGDHFDGLVALFGFIGTAFALLLAFIIVNVQGDQVSAETSLFSETSSMESILKQTKAYDPSLIPQVKPMILDYLEKMRRNEIDATPPIGGDQQAEAAFSAILTLYDKLDAADPGDDGQALFDEVAKLADLRDSRVDTPPGTLDGVTTVVCVLLALLTAIVMALLPAPRRWVRWAQALGVAVAVGLVMSLVFYIASDAYTLDSENIQMARVAAAV
jgi:hypothetical protein